MGLLAKTVPGRSSLDMECHLRDMIVGIPPPHTTVGVDKIIWGDGSILEEARFTAVGRIICDRGGIWIVGYNKYLGNCSVFYAESWGIIEGLSLIVKRGYDSVVIQSNCFEAVIAI
ncbi:hypothetical protein PVK06_036763 [Gossypium arboreum]|uniref:RNase H type-1 domain-containing protein n=1 Tax=Gossypium arboreum TaxID=29729 RepID=A0ABR0NKG1_GOSAR|nr:hypothetical protein PVK06_036763 [Gossypium arboreum]